MCFVSVGFCAQSMTRVLKLSGNLEVRYDIKINYSMSG